jgi:lysophospholipase L1-like esterase
MSARTRSRLSRALVSTLAVVALLVVGAAPAEATTGHGQGARTYVALGDSYASGEGLAPYEAGAGRCDRSQTQSYPERLSQVGPRRFDRLISAACSGATTGAVLASQTDALTNRTRTVTLTVGGNDVGFSSVLLSCLYSPVPAVQQTLPGGQGCRAQDPQVDAAIAYLGGPAGGSGARVPLVGVIAAVADQAPHAQILVSGYPQLLGVPSTDCQVNPAAPLFISADDVTWIREETTALNAAIRAAVQRARAAGARVRYVDATRTFAGHGFCDRRTPWINGLVLAPGATLAPLPSSFHPTAKGQWAYAAAFVLATRGRH